eukprot:1135313-Pyramimonas_sp.AAC.1
MLRAARQALPGRALRDASGQRAVRRDGTGPDASEGGWPPVPSPRRQAASRACCAVARPHGALLSPR